MIDANQPQMPAPSRPPRDLATGFDFQILRGRSNEQGTYPMVAADYRLNEFTLERLQNVVAEFFCAISTALGNDRAQFAESVRRAADLLNIEPDEATNGARSPSPSDSAAFRGGLAPWQVRKVSNFIEGNLDTVVRVDDMAALVNLSRYHFSRAFRQSFDESPHAFVVRRRIERAQGLMLAGTSPLAQIAAECGLADQAHFTRLFKRLVGESPGAWRRARASCS